jgi:hypothetical protein
MFSSGKYDHLQKLKGRLSSLILVSILAFNVCGYYIYFNLAQDNIRREIRARIREGSKEKDLTVIEISGDSANEIRWIKPNKEFTYQGNMYDVVKIKQRNGRKAYYCINDTKENKLIADFSRKCESNQKARKLVSSFSQNYVFQPESLFHINETSNHDFTILSFDIRSKIKEVCVPPPKYSFPA